ITKASDLAIYSIDDYTGNQTQCLSVYFYFRDVQFDFEATAIPAYYSENIKPSYLQLLNCSPKKFKTISNEDPYEQIYDQVTGCQQAYSAISRLGGISTEQCYDTTGKVGDACQTSCQKYGSKFISWSESYPSEISSSLLKKLILRFGPVLVYYGWTTNSGILYFRGLERTGAGNLEFYIYPYTATYSNIITVKVFTELREQCTSQTVPKVGCTCNGEQFSPLDCICPKEASELTGIPKDKCGCVPDDPRTGCEKETCTSTRIVDIPPQGCFCSKENNPDGCTCPIDSSQLTGISRYRCPCRDTGDPRAGTGPCPAYCEKGETNVLYLSICECEVDNEQYPVIQCEKVLQCINDELDQCCDDYETCDYDACFEKEECIPTTLHSFPHLNTFKIIELAAY
ncbi:MAG: hypothetical protein EZS28_018664, partial [Streblomastix strix]